MKVSTDLQVQPARVAANATNRSKFFFISVIVFRFISVAKIVIIDEFAKLYKNCKFLIYENALEVLFKELASLVELLRCILLYPLQLILLSHSLVLVNTEGVVW